MKKHEDLQSALARLVEMLRERLGPAAASDLLESYALDLAQEADREKAGQDDPAA
jgi:hypothetical protein